MADTPITRTIIRVALSGLALLAAPMVDLAAAQDRQGPTVEVAAGWVGFTDNTLIGEGLVAGAARWYLLPRISVGPEIAYIDDHNHSHRMVTGNVTWDMFPPTSGQPRRITPFLVAGGGVFQTRESFPLGSFTSSEGAFTAGGGIRVVIGDRMTVGVETRIGWEL